MKQWRGRVWHTLRTKTFMPVDEITNSGEPEFNFKHSLSQIPFLCVYSVYYKSPWDLKKNLPLKNILRHRLIEENGFAYTLPNQGEKGHRLVEAFSTALLPFYRKDETEARRSACVYHMFVRAVWYIFTRDKHLLWLAPKLIQPFPFPSLGFIGAHHFRSPIANRRVQLFLSNISSPARLVTRLPVLEDYWNKSYR